MEAAREICDVYGDNAVAGKTAQDWFAKFKNGNFDLDDTPRSGQPSDFDEDHLKALLKEDGRQTTRELAEKMNCTFKTIANHFHSLGFIQKLGAWVPHNLSDQNKKNRREKAV